MASYQELLRHPKWQRKRLEIMERAGFKCERCNTNDSMLSIHHSYYEKGCSPWEYPDSSFHCLCERCHEYAGLMLVAMNRQMRKLSLDNVERMLGYGRGLELKHCPRAFVKVHSLNLADGVSDAFRMRSVDVLKQIERGRLSHIQVICKPARLLPNPQLQLL